MQRLQPAVMQAGPLCPGARYPPSNRLLGVAEHAAGGRTTQPFSQRCKHQLDPLRADYQPVEGRVAAGREGRAAGLTAQRLDVLDFAVRVIADDACRWASVMR